MLVDFLVFRSDDLDSDVDDEDYHDDVVIGLQYKYNTFFLSCKIYFRFSQDHSCLHSQGQIQSLAF